MKAPIIRFRHDEADLIVTVLAHYDTRLGSETIYADVDRPARTFTRKRIREVIKHIQHGFPEAGK